MQIAIVDYGAGNTTNVKNAFEKLGVDAVVSDSETDWKNADALILPGVGSFGAAMKKIDGKKATIIGCIESGKPFLGICLGMQLLLEKSEESEGVNGLCLIPGQVKKFSSLLPVPQIGWNRVDIEKPCPLFEGLNNFYAYFVHSYFCEPTDVSVTAATTEYGTRFSSAITVKNLFATQFHPEKSGKDGLAILQNFINEVKR